MATLGAIVLTARERAGLSQQELAKRLGVGQSRISQLEKNEIKRPNPDLLEGLERELGISRRTMNIALGYLPEDSPFDLIDELRRINQIEDINQRALALAELPPEVQEAIRNAAIDYLRAIPLGRE